MGLRAYIYRPTSLGKCANGGISDNHEVVTIINADGPFDPTDDAPAVKIATNSMGNAIIVPADERPQGCVGPMMGGTFVNTSDSRFGEAVRRIGKAQFYGAVPFHDRFETTEQYRALSI